MSNYTIAVAWSGKDALSDSDAAKVISGDDFNTEFTAVQTAVNTKADLNGSTTEAFNSSNLAAAGTLAVTGATTLVGATTAAAITASGTVTLNGSVAGTGVKDEDDMASDSATSIATQQSIKAYVAAQIATVTTTVTWTYITRYTLFTSTTGNHNTATSSSVPTAQVPATASAIILTFLTQADETTTTANIAATGIAEREVGKAFAPNNSDDAAGSYNTITIPYKSSVDIKWVTGNTGNASNKVLVYIDGYIT